MRQKLDDFIVDVLDFVRLNFRIQLDELLLGLVHKSLVLISGLLDLRLDLLNVLLEGLQSLFQESLELLLFEGILDLIDILLVLVDLLLKDVYEVGEVRVLLEFLLLLIFDPGAEHEELLGGAQLLALDDFDFESFEILND